MVKMMRFEFSPGIDPTDFTKFAWFGDCVKSDLQMFERTESANVSLEPDEIWSMGFDQSTSNTGIFIKNQTNTIAYMIECARDSRQEADDYLFGLEMFLHRLCEKTTVLHIIYEKPIDTDSYRSAQVLFQLEGIIRQLHRRYPEFRAAKTASVVNSSWFSVVVLDELKKGNRKIASRESLHTIMPWTCQYGASLGKDQDIFDAMGVLFGWFITSFDALGRPYAREEKYHGDIAGFYLQGVGSRELAEQFTEKGIEAKWYVEDPKASIFNNIVSSITKGKVALLELTVPYTKLSCAILSNARLEDEKAPVTLVLFAENFPPAGLKEITGDNYSFVL